MQPDDNQRDKFEGNEMESKDCDGVLSDELQSTVNPLGDGHLAEQTVYAPYCQEGSEKIGKKPVGVVKRRVHITEPEEAANDHEQKAERTLPPQEPRYMIIGKAMPCKEECGCC